ncbi:thiamine-phosphate kinase [Breoghania sp. L-A4]|uniref:thiamine-phosphate kinase n=1 Tax=Breoghania sp. L-A4 TaxID=2304600 RepID=UPI000E35911D|nr:thiamine-phosphate kinase [Breoghania sp. L-A4]AXS40267.1 thiamine-phosphate kinase [Breoghania sp. L-A4]
MSRIGEFELIERYLAPLATDPGSFELVDDAAVLTPPPGHDLVLTKDMLAAGVHFFPDDPPAAIAQKALRVNLSDLAAKGAQPLGYLLGLGLPQGWEEEWIAGFSAGLRADQADYGVVLYGGDTIKSGNGMVLSVTAIGHVPAGRAVRRHGARPGDHLYATGTIGDAALGLRLRLDPASCGAWALSEAERGHLLGRYLLPRPRVAAAPAVLRYARASMDISDGLAGDLGKLLSASGVGADVEVARVPLSDAARRATASDPTALATALTGGDDYELLVAVSPDDAPAFERMLAQARVESVRIGVVTQGAARARFINDGGGELTLGQASYAHF